MSSLDMYSCGNSGDTPTGDVFEKPKEANKENAKIKISEKKEQKNEKNKLNENDEKKINIKEKEKENEIKDNKQDKEDNKINNINDSDLNFNIIKDDDGDNKE